MLRILLVTGFALLTFDSAFAAGAGCSKATPDKFKPQADLITTLKNKGVSVSKVKVEKGCYETYGIDASGKKINAAYNAETLEPVANPEAGEN